MTRALLWKLVVLALFAWWLLGFLALLGIPYRLMEDLPSVASAGHACPALFGRGYRRGIVLYLTPGECLGYWVQTSFFLGSTVFVLLYAIIRRMKGKGRFRVQDSVAADAAAHKKQDD